MRLSIIRVVFINLLIINTLSSINAQTRLKLEAGLGLPIGDFAQLSGMGAGLGISTQHYFGEKFSLGLAVNYTRFAEKNNVSYRFVPLNLVFRYDLSSQKLKPYLGLGLGIFTLIRQENFSGGKLNSNQTSAGLMPMFGLNYPLAKHWDVDFNITYAQGFKQNSKLQTLNAQLGIWYRW
jgi:opacity protein-like surface antigen